MGYDYSFCQIFQGLCLFKGVRLFQTLEYLFQSLVRCLEIQSANFIFLLFYDLPKDTKDKNFNTYSLLLERKSQHKSPWQICKFPIWPFRSEKKMLLLFFSGTHWKESESFHYIGVGFFSIHNEMKKFLKKQSQFFPQNIFLPQQHLNPFVFQAASDCAIYW